MKKVNRYQFTFTAECPSDGDMIRYEGEIVSGDMIRVESINETTGQFKKGFHEDLADQLASRFGGLQTLTAVHQGVRIVSHRWPDPPMNQRAAQGMQTAGAGASH